MSAALQAASGQGQAPAAYSASKAALSAYTQALRCELRHRQVLVIDAQLPHVESDFAHQAIAGTPPCAPRRHKSWPHRNLLVNTLSKWSNK